MGGAPRLRLCAHSLAALERVTTPKHEGQDTEPTAHTTARATGSDTSEYGAFFRTLDSAVAKFGEKVPFPIPIHGGADMSKGTHFLLWDNYWNTNYVFWWPYETKPGFNSDNILFRFAIELHT